MKPIRVPGTNALYVAPPGAEDEVADLPCTRLEPGVVASVWWLTPAERQAIAAGANVVLTIASEPLPPLRLNISDVQGIGDDAPDVLERLEQLRAGG